MILNTLKYQKSFVLLHSFRGVPMMPALPYILLDTFFRGEKKKLVYKETCGTKIYSLKRKKILLRICSTK